MLHQLNILNTSFGQSSAMANTLVIEFSKTTMCFCEMQSAINKPHFIQPVVIDNQNQKSVTEQFLLAINQLGFHKKNYEQVLINVCDSFFTLCPNALFEQENARQILEFNCGDSKNKPLLVDDVNATIKLIYAIDEELKSTLDKLFPQHQIKHQLTVLSKLMLNAEEFVKDELLIAIDEQTISVVLKQQQQIVLANKYQIKTNEDVLYYVLFIIEQYQLNPLTLKLSLIGNIEVNTELINSLKKYIKQIRLATGNKLINWEQLKGMPQHFYFTLVNRLFCE